MDWRSNWFLFSMFSDRLDPEMMLKIEDFKVEGDEEVVSMSEFGIGELDSWKGVEGCVEAVLSAMSPFAFAPPQMLRVSRSKPRRTKRTFVVLKSAGLNVRLLVKLILRKWCS